MVKAGFAPKKILEMLVSSPQNISVFTTILIIFRR